MVNDPERPAHPAPHTRSGLEIDGMLRRWADAVQAHDMAAILAHHAADIVMYDVPAPTQICGIDGYRDSWTPFYDSLTQPVFTWQTLDVVASDDVAFAHGVITCGKAADPSTQIPVRLTIGLQRTSGTWLVVHEHHSVPTSSP